MKRFLFPVAVAIGLAVLVVLTWKPPASPPATKLLGDAATSASPSPSASAPTNGVRYDCAGIAPNEAELDAATCAAGATPRSTDALVHYSEKLTEVVGMHKPPTPEWWAPARAALDEAAKGAADPKTMSLPERVAVQNAALHLAVASRAARVRDALPTDAMKLVDRLAFTPEERAQLEARPVDLTRWLGPAADRLERTKRTQFFHEQVAHHTRVVRLVRTPRLRANFAELIAIDTTGAPFVTSIIGAMEIRRGTRLDAPACVALLSPERVRCEAFDGLVEARDLTTLPQSYFLRRDERGELRCNDCHGISGNEPLIGAVDLDPATVPEELASHRKATLARLRPLLEPLRPLPPRYSDGGH